MEKVGKSERDFDSIWGTLIRVVTVTRNYGATAQEKSNELLKHLLLATLSVTLLIALALGWRSSMVVLAAVPVTLALTLFIYFIYGYTLNRVTLFALIFSIGILVDDAIVVVENITRHFHLPENKGRPWRTSRWRRWMKLAIPPPSPPGPSSPPSCPWRLSAD
jgi:Cu/Ag efflux pump CusA